MKNEVRGRPSGINRRHFITALASFGACPLCAGLARADEDPHWSYEGDAGPDHWGSLGKVDEVCSIGGQQSPVDITGTVRAALPPIAVSWNGGGKIVNNGHTIQINVPRGSKLVRGQTEYELVQYHFHTPSEHAVGGKRFAMEVHFVHQKIGSKDLGVLGVFLVPGAANRTFAKLASAFPQQAGQEADVADLNPRSLVPFPINYWAYEGSLTTPPCSEIVDWMVAKSPIQVAAADIAKFSALFPMNARPIMPAGRRFILSAI